MEKPNIEDIAKERSSKYKKEVGKLDVDVVDRELGQLAFKDGFEDAVREFAVEDIIEALMEAEDHLGAIKSGKLSPKGYKAIESFKKVTKALEKAGV